MKFHTYASRLDAIPGLRRRHFLRGSRSLTGRVRGKTLSSKGWPACSELHENISRWQMPVKVSKKTALFLFCSGRWNENEKLHDKVKKHWKKTQKVSKITHKVIDKRAVIMRQCLQMKIPPTTEEVSDQDEKNTYHPTDAAGGGNDSDAGAAVWSCPGGRV